MLPLVNRNVLSARGASVIALRRECRSLLPLPRPALLLPIPDLPVPTSISALLVIASPNTRHATPLPGRSAQTKPARTPAFGTAYIARLFHSHASQTAPRHR